MKWNERFGRWYLIIWESESKLIEVGFGENTTEGNYGAFQSKTWNFMGTYITITRPTLSYVTRNKNNAR